MKKILIALALLVWPMAAQAASLKVVASFSVIGDMVRQVAGDKADVTVIVGPDQDLHAYQLKPADMKTITAAQLVFANGAGLESWITTLQKKTDVKQKIVILTDGITLASGQQETDQAHTDHDHGHGQLDPHAWHDLRNGLVYVNNIERALSAAAPEYQADFQRNALAYRQQMTELNQQVVQAVQAVEVNRRVFVTNHDALGYYARAYGFRIIPAMGMSTETEPNAKAIAAVIRQVKMEKVPAVFLENISNPRLLKRIADEGGAKVGGTLISDALSADIPEASTYLGMIKYNTQTILKELY